MPQAYQISFPSNQILLFISMFIIFLPNKNENNPKAFSRNEFFNWCMNNIIKIHGIKMSLHVREATTLLETGNIVNYCCAEVI